MIVIVGCGKRKKTMRCEAKYLYTGQLFASHMELAAVFPAREVRIISAHYGLLELDREIEDYDQAISKMSVAERKAWEAKIASEVELLAEPGELVVLLAGDAYSRWADLCDRRVRSPLRGLTLGERRMMISRFCKGARAAPFDDEGDDEVTWHELQDEIPDEVKHGGVGAPKTVDEGCGPLFGEQP